MSPALLEGGNADVNLQIDWGELQVKGHGSIADLSTLTGADLHMNISTPDRRPLLELLGISEVADGPLEFAGRITDAKPGFAVEAHTRMDEFTVQVNGTIESPRSGLRLA